MKKTENTGIKQDFAESAKHLAYSAAFAACLFGILYNGYKASEAPECDSENTAICENLPGF